MTQLGDFRAEPPPGMGSARRGPIVAGAVAVVLALAVGIYWLLGDGEEEPTVETVVETPTPAPSPPPPPPEPEPEPPELALPSLDQSDETVRELVGTLSSHPELASWLVSDGMIRRFAVVVENVANGNNPSQQLPFMRPGTRFRTVGQEPRLSLDPDGYRRYDVHAQVLDSLDPEGTAEFFRTLEPLLDEAYAELGYPDTRFRRTLERAITHLLAVPIVSEPPVLLERAPFFHFEDDRLEELTPVQKQLLAMGPTNVQTVQRALRSIAQAIGLRIS